MAKVTRLPNIDAQVIVVNEYSRYRITAVNGAVLLELLGKTGSGC